MPIYWKSFPFPARVMTLLCKLLLGEDSNSEQANKSKTLLTLRTSLYHSVFFLSLSRQFAPHTFNEIKITQRTACMTVPSHLLTKNAQYDVSVALPTSDAEPSENIQPDEKEKKTKRTRKKKNRRLLCTVFLPRGVAFAQRAIHLVPESQIKWKKKKHTFCFASPLPRTQ